MARRKKAPAVPPVVPHDQGHCPTCQRLARLPWVQMAPDDLATAVQDFTHELVTKIGERFGRVGVAVTFFSETHHATTVSNVPDEWLENLGRELMRSAARRSAARALPPKDLN